MNSNSKICLAVYHGPDYLRAYTFYFSKLIKSFLEEGIEIDALHVQNGPNSVQNFPSLVWKPQDLGIFVADYLGPQFKKVSISTNIWLVTIERRQIERVADVLQYPGVLDLVKVEVTG